MKKKTMLVIIISILLVLDAYLLYRFSNESQRTSTEFYKSINPGLIAHYEFNNGSGKILYDHHSTNGFNGSFVGSPEWCDGRWSKGLEFGGSGDYVDISKVAEYIYKNGVKSITLTAWINTTATGLLEIIGDNDIHIFAELQLENNGTVHFWMENSSDADYMVWSNSPLNDGKWHFIVGQYNYTTKVMEIWVDGVLNQRRTYTFEPSVPTNYCIGHGDNDDFMGSIDEVRIYERTLTPEEISFLYNYSDIHNPIRINNDSEFASFIEKEHLAGDGSETSPYEISGYNIDAYGAGDAIYIGNTTVHFIVDECHLYNATYQSSPYTYGAGITLYNVMNGTISKVKAEDEYAGIFLRDSSNVTGEENFIRNITYGIYAEGYHTKARNITFSHNAIELAQDEGTYVYWAENLTVDNNTILNSPSAYGIFLYYVDHSIVENNTVDTALNGILIEDTSYNTYRGNVINNTSAEGIYTYESEHERFEENTILNLDDVGIEMDESYYMTFIKNYIQTVKGFYTGIRIEGGDVLYSNTLVNCGLDMSTPEIVAALPDNNTVNGKPIIFYRDTNLNNITIENAGQVFLYNVSWVTLKNLSIESVPYGIYGEKLNNITVDNVSVSNDEDGIRIERSENITINGGRFYNSSSYGIQLELSSNSRIINSRVTNISDTGIYIDQSDHTTVEGNVVERSRNGMWITGDYNYIANNSILNSSHYGIRIGHYHNTITGNVIVNSTDYGIYIGSGYTGNMIYRNYLYRNHGSNGAYNASHIQAYDYSGNNYWNSSTEGNYWYDWANNNDTNDRNYNGIVDWPYRIDGGNAMDYYPLSNYHGLIRINSDDDFTTDNGVIGGSGTKNDPYIISGWKIDAHGAGNAIYIGNTTKYFKIENCTLFNTTYDSFPYYYGSAITLYNVTNGYIGYSEIYDTDTFGVLLNNTRNTTLEHNRIHDNYGYGGVWEKYSTNITFLWNEFVDNYIGLYLSNSNDNNVLHNYFRNSTSSGLYIESGTRSMIYDNYFYFNNGSNGTYDASHVQAADNGNNYWNSSTKGNYWYDWAYNNDTNDKNHDGIVDWPYCIGSNSGAVLDHYPISRFRGVIRINGNDDFIPQNGVIAGIGSEDDPYLIFGWSINASGEGNGIYIGNTSVHFIIESVHVEDAKYVSSPYFYGAGIEIYNVSAGEIRNTVSVDNEAYGVLIYDSKNVEISNSSMGHNGEAGLKIDSSTNIRVIGCNIDSNIFGIYLTEANYNIIYDDTITNSMNTGIYLASSGGNEINKTNVWGSNKEGIFIAGGESNRILNSTIHHNDGNGIKIVSSSKYNLIYDSWIYRNAQNGTYIETNENELINNTIDNNDHCGVYLDNADDNLLSDNTVTGNEEGVHISNYAAGNRIENNNISSNSKNGIYMGSGYNNILNNSMWGNGNGTYLDQVSHIIIRNNTFGRGMNGVKMKQSEQIKMENNTYPNVSSHAVYSEFAKNITLRNEAVAGCGQGLYISQGRDNSFFNITVRDSQYEGLWLIDEFNDTLVGGNYSHNGLYESNYHGMVIHDSHNITMETLSIYNNAVNGIFIESSSSNITIYNVSFNGNGMSGIQIDSSSFITVTNSTFHSNYFGILISGGSHDCLIEESTLNYNNNGIRITTSSKGNVIRENNITSHTGYGVYIDDSSSGNLIYNNSFYYNYGSTDTYDSSHVQAYDANGSNYWNTSGNPHGYGNFWYDWQCPDDDNNGIVDYPYDIDGGTGAKDYYPIAGACQPVPEFSAYIVAVMFIIVILAIYTFRRKK